MTERVNLSPFIGSVITLLFVFSTIYTLAFYFYQGESKNTPVSSLGTAKNPTSLSFLGILDGILSMLSWISPFALVRGLVYAITPADLFTVLDLLLLRPVSWIVSIITANYIVSKIPTISGE